MKNEDRIFKKLDLLDSKIDILIEQTGRQDERIKQNTKTLDSQRKKIWGVVVAAISAIGTVIIAIFR